MRIELTGDIATCRDLRRAVFIDEQGIAEADEWDDLDDQAIHLLAWRDGRAVGTARILLKGQVGKLGRICVLPQARGTGLGAQMVRASMDILRTRPGIMQVRLSAQESAIGFYEKLGFAVVSGAYDDAGIPHYDMIREL
ncbi:GNAT family N-acetyltransferase [Paracoccus fistulariae]|uniref:GNAT family N-acetyltransferase n=1 Tax=Paracoccus fistulariae TaxID=658446 RepID=A0ABY7SKW3_9RHOB|nr:GNAT family N-acetyltransferase [Paracoccus fistulariae]MDB6182154.1 GNAT family N-acetyltransferase [Paracoccus fistulariae]WCR06621.1 GNAT family N-acetyltransferase [Paracoccus fistulariae]